MFKTLYKKCLELAAHKSSNFYLGFVSFVESSFFPIPPDVMIIPMVVAKKNEFLRIAIIATIFSVLGALFGYFIGYVFFNEVGIKIIKNSSVIVGGNIECNACKFFSLCYVSASPIIF